MARFLAVFDTDPLGRACHAVAMALSFALWPAALLIPPFWDAGSVVLSILHHVPLLGRVADEIPGDVMVLVGLYVALYWWASRISGDPATAPSVQASDADLDPDHMGKWAAWSLYAGLIALGLMQMGLLAWSGYLPTWGDRFLLEEASFIPANRCITSESGALRMCYDGASSDTVATTALWYLERVYLRDTQATMYLSDATPTRVLTLPVYHGRRYYPELETYAGMMAIDLGHHLGRALRVEAVSMDRKGIRHPRILGTFDPGASSERDAANSARIHPPAWNHRECARYERVALAPL